MMHQFLLSVSGYALMLTFLANPVTADTVCVSGNLSTIVDTTCDIGSLKFAFGPLVGGNGLSSNWAPSDFNFTVLSNGFEVSGLPAQTVTVAVGGAPRYDYAQLRFFVADMAGQITGVNVYGGNLSVSGAGSLSNASAMDAISLTDFSLVPFADVQSLEVSNTLQDVGGTATDYVGNSLTGPLLFGSGYASLFELYASGGSTASIDNTATSFTFTTVPGPSNPPAPFPSPEPRFLSLISLGILGLAYASKGKWRRESRLLFPK